MSIAKLSAYDEVYDFLLTSPTPEQITAFRTSEATQARVRYLLDTNRNGTLTTEEQAELDEFASVEHFVRVLKARARKHLA